jgi:hypothetical protein
MKLQTFFDGAGLALCCGPRRVGGDMPVGPRRAEGLASDVFDKLASAIV